MVLLGQLNWSSNLCPHDLSWERLIFLLHNNAAATRSGHDISIWIFVGSENTVSSGKY